MSCTSFQLKKKTTSSPCSSFVSYSIECSRMWLPTRGYVYPIRQSIVIAHIYLYALDIQFLYNYGTSVASLRSII